MNEIGGFKVDLKDYSKLILDKIQGQFSGERISFLTNGSGKIGHSYDKKLKLDAVHTLQK